MKILYKKYEYVNDLFWWIKTLFENQYYFFWVFITLLKGQNLFGY